MSGHHHSELPSAHVVAHSRTRFKRGLTGLRNKVTTLERQLLAKVHEDPRFGELPKLCVQQLQTHAFEGGNQRDNSIDEGNDYSSTFLTGTSEERRGSNATTNGISPADVAAGADEAGGRPTSKPGTQPGSEESRAASLDQVAGVMNEALAEEVVANAAKELVRICLEDWELEGTLSKLMTSRTMVQKLDKEKMEGHHAYMAEVQSLRDRCMRLERKTPIEFHIPVGDVVFYDPTAYLEPDLRELTKEIVEFKVREEIANQTGVVDETPELKMEIKELKKTIKDLEAQIKELEDEKEKEKPARSKMPPRQQRPQEVPPPKPVVQRVVETVEQQPDPSADSTLCRKCGGPLRDTIIEEKIVEKIVEKEKVVEVVKYEKGNVVMQDSGLPDWLKDDEETRKKRAQLKKMRNELAECKGRSEEIENAIKSLESGGPLLDGDDVPPGKKDPDENKERKRQIKALKEELKAKSLLIKDLEKGIEELRFLDPDYTDSMTRGMQTMPWEPETIVKEVIKEVIKEVKVQGEAPPPQVIVKEKKQKVEKEVVAQKEEVVVEKPKKKDTSEQDALALARLQAELDALRAENARLQKALDDLGLENKKLAAAARPKPVPKPKPGEPQIVIQERPKREARSIGPPPDVKGKSKSDMAALLVHELRGEHNDARTNGEDEDLCDQMDKTTDKLGTLLAKMRAILEDTSKDDLIAKLQAENEALNERNRQLQMALDQLGAKLREAQQMLIDAGLGDLADKIFADVGLDDLMNFKAVNVFERLYNDALRRIRGDLMKALREAQGDKSGSAFMATLRHLKKAGLSSDDDLEINCPHCGKSLSGGDGLDVLTNPSNSMANNAQAGLGTKIVRMEPMGDKININALQSGQYPKLAQTADFTEQLTMHPEVPLTLRGRQMASPAGMDRALSPTGMNRATSSSPGQSSSRSPSKVRTASKPHTASSPLRATLEPTLPSAPRTGGDVSGQLLNGALPPSASPGLPPDGVRGEHLAHRMESPKPVLGGTGGILDLSSKRAAVATPGAGTKLNISNGAGTVAPGGHGAGTVASPDGYATVNLGVDLEPLSGMRMTTPLPPPPLSRVQKGKEREQEKESSVASGGLLGSALPDLKQHSLYLEFPKNESFTAISKSFQSSHGKQKMSLGPISGMDHDASLRSGLGAVNVGGGVSALAASMRHLPPAREALRPIEGSGMMPPRAQTALGQAPASASAPHLGAMFNPQAAPNVVLLSGSSPFPNAAAGSAGPVGSVVPGSSAGSRPAPGLLRASVSTIGEHLFRDTAEVKRNLLEPVRLVKDTGGHVSHGKMDRWAADEDERSKRRAGHLQARSMTAPKLGMQGEPPPKSYSRGKKPGTAAT